MRIPRRMAWLFAEHHLDDLDVERDARLVLARVLEHGRMEDVRWCVQHYGLVRIDLPTMHGEVAGTIPGRGEDEDLWLTNDRQGRLVPRGSESMPTAATRIAQLDVTGHQARVVGVYETPDPTMVAEAPNTLNGGGRNPGVIVTDITKMRITDLPEVP